VEKEGREIDKRVKGQEIKEGNSKKRERIGNIIFREEEILF